MWTDNEKQILIENYPIMTTSELMILLNKSEGQIRGMKERLGLNQKLNVFTNEEKELIRKFYEENSEQLNLDDFAKKLNRPKTSICRYANKEGLTKSSRPMTELKKKTLSDKAKEFILTEKYQKEIYPNQVALLTYYAQNEHPKGMLNKHHTDDVRQKMSKSHIELARNMTTEEKHDIAMKAVQTRLHNGGYNTTDEIVQIIKDVENQATQLEDMVRADGHSGFTLKGIPSIQEPSKGNISKPKSQPALENKEEKQIKQSKDVAKAKEKEADTVVAANDKIAKSEKKAAAIVASPSTPPTPPKYKVVSAPKLAHVKNNDVIDETKNTADAMNQSADAVIEAKKKESDAVVNSNDKIAKSEEKVAIKTVSGLKNSNSNLTETPVTPPELDGLKQLSQREFGDAQKYIKVYEDTNRTIYTLTQTYKKQFDANGNLLAEGYENAIAYYDSYEKLEGEAIKLSKKIK